MARWRGVTGRLRLARPRFTAESLPNWMLGIVIVAAGPLLVFHYGAYHWFRLDDWSYLTGRGFPNLFEPHAGAHWMAVPRLIYYGLWQIFGARTYRPYQISVVMTHLVLAVLLHAIMRRAGVRPWLSFAAVTLFVLLGPGAANSVWGFQVGFNGSIAWGLGWMLLADHDGPPDRRDLLGLGCGLLAITSSAAGVTLAVGVIVAALLRRGWRIALLHGGPLLAIYAGWVLIADVSTGRPPLRLLSTWVSNAVIGTFLGLGRFHILAWIFVAVLVVGMALVCGQWRGRDLRAMRQRLAMPVGLFVAAGFFVLTTFTARWWAGPMGARAERYAYLEAILVLPLLAVSAEAIAERWRRLTPALVALFLLPVPFNLAGFDAGVYGAPWMANREYVLTTAVRVPFARDVPRDVRPMSSAIVLDPVTIGFLLDAAAEGRLTPSNVPLTPAVIDEFKVRLGVARRVRSGHRTDCQTYDQPITLEPQVGDVLHLGSGVRVAAYDGLRPSKRQIVFPGSAQGDAQLTIELPDLSLWIGPVRSATMFRLCQQGTDVVPEGDRARGTKP